MESYCTCAEGMYCGETKVCAVEEGVDPSTVFTGDSYRVDEV